MNLLGRSAPSVQDVVTTPRLFKGWPTYRANNSRSQHEAPAVCTEAAGNFTGAA